MKRSSASEDEERHSLQLKYDITAWFYDIQDFLAPLVEKIYGARFDRNTLENLQNSPMLKITNTYFLKRDIYQVIEGYLVE